MAFYLSPGVFVRELDLTTTIPAVATNISVLVVKDSYKGEEYKQHFVTNDDQLINTVGKPTERSYKDILAGVGFLKYGSMLYVSTVKPEDATFATVRIQDGYNENGVEHDVSYTFLKEGSVSGENEEYTYESLGITDISTYSEAVENPLAESTDDVLWFTSIWRGKSANNIRVLVFDQDLFNAIKYFDESNEVIDLPENTSISAEASASAIDMYNEGTLGYTKIRTSDIKLDSPYQFGVIIQNKEQGSSVWADAELFIVSSDEGERDDSGNPLFIEDVINEQSQYVKVALNSNYRTTDEVDNGPIAFGIKNVSQLSGGYDGEWGRADSVDYQDAVDAAVINAYNMYSNPEEIDVNLFIESDKSVTVKNKLIEIAQVIRKDSMAILDVPRNIVINNKGNEALDLTKWRKGQGGSTFNPNSSYAACYANWLEVFDKWNKKYRWVPASGHIAGMYANTDDVADPWFAAAGLNRAILTGVRRLAWNPNQGERDLIYQAGLNPIVSFAGQGKVVWGQKTLLDKSSAFNRINVRRLFLVLQKAISKASKYFLFEMNDEVTWMLMTNMITPFLRDIKGRRGIYDFKVQIDQTTNTPVRIDRNELWGNIWIQPGRTAEFIVLNFIATPTGANFDELIGAAG